MLTLHGYAHSTYTWSVRLALHEKGVDYTLVPARLGDPAYAALHPWRKMPVLDHDGFRLFESAAILRYIDEAFEGPPLQPADLHARARMTQWVSAYNDFVAPEAVRGVLIQRFVRAPQGRPVDDNRVRASAAKARTALAVFDAALDGAAYLAGDALSLADLLLLPTVVSAQRLEGDERYTDNLPNLTVWRDRLCARPSFAATLPESA